MTTTNNSLWGSSDDPSSGDSSPAPAKETTAVKVKRVPAEKKAETNPPDKAVTGIGKIFPAIGQAVDDFEERQGDLRITEKQLPEIVNWKPEREYTLTVKGIMVDSDYDQDSEYDDAQHKRIATSDPFLRTRIKIIGIETADTETPGEGSGEETGM